jgi:hypothetical protein
VATNSDDEVRVGKPKTSAVGIPAIRYAMQYALSEMGVARSAKTLHELNQTGGFDCPSCAWPDPKAGERSFAEFWPGKPRAIALMVRFSQLTR